MQSFSDIIAEYLQAELALLVVSMVPLIELRGGVILGAALGIHWLEALVICIIGNVIPVPFVILFGRWTLDFLGQTKAFGSIVTKYKAKVMRKSDVIHKYGPWGLLLFVGIPLPGTGAWTGSVLALLMNLRMREAVPVILLGVVMAGVIMTLGSHGLLGIFELL
ncbi:MAG: small multi-drug export protein [Firmicutes bacterium]|nr:small multi-drug export protein [Bacillota bacterium]